MVEKKKNSEQVIINNTFHFDLLSTSPHLVPIIYALFKRAINKFI